MSQFASKLPLLDFLNDPRSGKESGPIEKFLLDNGFENQLRWLWVLIGGWDLLKSSNDYDRVIAEISDKLLQIHQFLSSEDKEISTSAFLGHLNLEPPFVELQKKLNPFVLGQVANLIFYSGMNVRELGQLSQRLLVAEKTVENNLKDLEKELKHLKAVTNVSELLAGDVEIKTGGRQFIWTMTLSLIGAVLTILVWYSSLSWPGLLAYDPTHQSQGFVLDLLYFIKVLSPSIIALLGLSFFIKIASKERHNYLLYKQRRTIALLAVPILERSPDKATKASVIAALSSSVLALHKSGYSEGDQILGINGFENIVKLLKK